MKTKTMYVADDGTPFNSMQECIAYEKSMNKYIVSFLKVTGEVLKQQDFDSEAKAKRFIADSLHRCFRDNFISFIRLTHLGTVVEFTSAELSKFVPAHYNIDGEKLNDIFQKAKMRNIHF